MISINPLSLVLAVNDALNDSVTENTFTAHLCGYDGKQLVEKRLVEILSKKSISRIFEITGYRMESIIVLATSDQLVEVCS